MTTEEFIKASAKRGWSKTQTREVLGLSTYKFWLILGAMPPIVWAVRGQSLGAKQSNASRKGMAPSAAMLSGIKKAQAANRARGLRTWQGRTGSVEELAEFSPVSARTITRRLKAGMSVDDAFGLEPNLETPIAGWRLQ